MKIYGLVVLMVVTMFVSTSEAREGLFARWRTRSNAASTGGYVSGGSTGGYVSSGSTGGYVTSTPSYGSTGSYSVEVVPTPIPMEVVPLSTPTYETSPRKASVFPVFPQMWKTKSACPNCR